ncbi:MAG: hypothetical protein J0M01_08030 [Dechloromonas sp.]|nr:hypothetical protein [Dechloromonas sp.]
MRIIDSPAWRALAAHAEAVRPAHLRELFAADGQRFERFSLRQDGLLLDFSKQRIDGEALALLHALAGASDLEGWKRKMVAGELVRFVQAKDSATITRRQRAEYIIRAGLPNDFVDEELKINLSDEAKPLIKAVEDLNRSTHVREETIVFKGQDVRFMFNRILHGLLNLLKIAQNSRAQLKETIADVIHHAIFENLISDAIQELDEISTHTIIDGHYIDAIVVRTLNATEIQYVVAGEVEVELQYGSNSDVRNDNGFRKDDSYPYTAVVNSNPAKPMEIRPNEVTLQVDNSSFYE